MVLFVCISLILVLLRIVADSTTSDFAKWQHGGVNVDGIRIHFRYAGNSPPLILIHGNPQHSMDTYTVIAPDNRGMGDSMLALDNDYSAEAIARDVKGILEYLRINPTYVFAHGKGCGPAITLATQHPGLVKGIGLGEYTLTGFGYEQTWSSTYEWNINSNWQYAMFSVPELATTSLTGREKELLTWYFFHASYPGANVIPEDVLNQYVTSIRKPSFLTAVLSPFAAYTVNADLTIFNKTLHGKPLDIPALVLGHWFADENPLWVANKIKSFLGELRQDVNTPVVDLACMIVACYIEEALTVMIHC
ncbi:Alpha/Beta hydrolase protein [Fusarium avenaceum]|nr:Alpha/Beta hydrolase protein [Fusarium avenaceum]